MIRANLAEAPCATCQKPLPPGKGRLVERDGKWKIFCPEHAEAGIVVPARQRVRLIVRNAKAYVEPVAFMSPEDFSVFREKVTEAGGRSSGSKWTFPINDMETFRKKVEATYDVDVDISVTTMIDNLEARKNGARAEAGDRLSRFAKKGLRLLTVQKEGVEWLSQRTTALHADLAGAGKTPQLLCSIPENRFVIAICPASVKSSWLNEATKWRSDYLPYVNSTTSKGGVIGAPSVNRMAIFNYEVIPEEIPPLPTGTVLIFDEAHRLRNKGTDTWLRARKLARAVRASGGVTWGATGDPLFNKPDDVYHILEVLELEDVFGSKKEFREMFNASQDQWGRWTWGMPDKRVPQLLKNVMLRRPTALFERMLPKATIQDVEVEVWDEIYRACDEAEALLRKLGVDLKDVMNRTASTRASRIAFQEISRVYAQLAAAKVPAALELIEPLEQQGEPVVVFSTHVDPLKALGQRDGWAVMTGGTPAGKRRKIISDFQSGKLRGLAAAIKACGFGITLTRSCFSINLDEDWVPASNRQARKRIHRLTQVRPVTHYRLVANHTLDQRIQMINDEKMALFLSVVEAACTPGTEIGDELPPVNAQIDVRPLTPPAPKRIVVPKRGQLSLLPEVKP